MRVVASVVGLLVATAGLLPSVANGQNEVICLDDRKFRLNGNPKKNCDWIAEQKPTVRYICDRRDQRTGLKVSEYCPLTCSGECDEIRSSSPSASPTPAAQLYCTHDDPDFKYKGNSYKNCDWAREKLNIRCNRKIKGTKNRIKDACPSACNVRCACVNSNKYKYNGRFQSCKFLETSECNLRADNGDPISYHCPRKCNACLSFPIPSPPSTAPSAAPSTAPSQSMHPSPAPSLPPLFTLSTDNAFNVRNTLSKVQIKYVQVVRVMIAGWSQSQRKLFSSGGVNDLQVDTGCDLMDCDVSTFPAPIDLSDKTCAKCLTTIFSVDRQVRQAIEDNFVASVVDLSFENALQAQGVWDIHVELEPGEASESPSLSPSLSPTGRPSKRPTRYPTYPPTPRPTHRPTRIPTKAPRTKRPSRKPTKRPRPTKQPTTPPPNTAAPTQGIFVKTEELLV